MKRILVLLGILISVAAAEVVFAQTEEGVITYEMKINMHRRLTGAQEGMKAMIPEFRTSKNQLFFSGTESMYKPLIEDEDEDVSSGGGATRITMKMPTEEIYLNPSSSQLLTKREFMGKEYLIIDTAKVSPWKFGTETKEILGYVCKQAYYTDASQLDRTMEITAWYADNLRPMLGPERYSSLPGTVLAIDVNNGEQVIVAKKVELKPLKKNDIKVPTGGIPISRAEFRKMAEEQMKKMGAGRGGMVIRH